MKRVFALFLIAAPVLAAPAADEMASWPLEKLNETREACEKEIRALQQRLTQIEAIIARKTGVPKEVEIFGWVDGGAELWIDPRGLVWRCTSPNNLKPGYHEQGEHPFTVNGMTWRPIWKRPEHRKAVDVSRPFRLNLGPANWKMEILSANVNPKINQVGPHRVLLNRKGRNQVISIPDPASGGRFYRIRLYRE